MVLGVGSTGALVSKHVAVGSGGFWMGWGVDKKERGRDFGELLWV